MSEYKIGDEVELLENYSNLLAGDRVIITNIKPATLGNYLLYVHSKTRGRVPGVYDFRVRKVTGSPMDNLMNAVRVLRNAGHTVECRVILNEPREVIL